MKWRNNRSLLWYSIIYGFALFMGLFAIVFCFIFENTQLSRITSILANAISVIVAISQISLNTCGRHQFGKKCRKKASTIIGLLGLVLINVFTIIAAVDSYIMKYIGFISLGLYYIAFIIYGIKICRSYVKDYAQAARTSSSRYPNGENEERQVHARAISTRHTAPAGASRISAHFHSHDGGHVVFKPNTGPQMHHGDRVPSRDPLPILLPPPSYSEAVDMRNGFMPVHSRPAQRHFENEVEELNRPGAAMQQVEREHLGDQQIEAVSRDVGTDSPPDYQDICHDPVIEP